MRPTLVLALAVLAVAAVLLWLRVDLTTAGDRGPGIPEPSVQPAAATDPSAIEQQVPASERRAATPVMADAATSSLRVRAVERDGGAPVPAERVATARGDGRTALPFSAAGTTDRSGELLLTDLPAGLLAVRLADAPSPTWCDLEAGVVHEVAIEVEASCTFTGVVVTSDRTPCPGAELWVSDENVPEGGVVVGSSGSDGRFRFGVRGRDRLLVARACRVGVSTSVPLNEPREPDEELEIVLEYLTAAMVGHIVDGNGHPVADARVTIGQCDFSLGECIAMGPYSHDPHYRRRGVPPICTRSDAHGDFRADAVAIGSLVWVDVLHDAWARWSKQINMTPGETSQVDVQLQQPLRVTGRVTDRDGRSLERVFVEASPREDRVFDRPDWIRSSTMTEADGTYCLTCLAPGQLELNAEGGSRGRARQRLDGAAATILQWDPVLDPGHRIRGRVLDEEGSALVGWTVEAGGRSSRRRSEPTDQAGRFVITQCGEGQQTLSVQQRDAWMPTDVATRADVVPDGDPVDLIVRHAAIVAGFIRGEVLDGDGRPTRSVVSIRVANGLQSQQMSAPVAEGRFALGALQSGSLDVTFSIAGHEPITVPRFSLASGEVRDLGTLTAARLAVLELRVADERGPIATGTVALRDRSGEIGNVTGITRGQIRLRPRAGSYQLLVWAPGSAFGPGATVDLQAGRTTAVSSDLVAGTTRDFSVVGERGWLREPTTVQWFDATGVLASEELPTADAEAEFERRFLPGEYRVQVRNAHVTGSATFDVPATPENRARVVVQLRPLTSAERARRR